MIILTVKLWLLKSSMKTPWSNYGEIVAVVIALVCNAANSEVGDKKRLQVHLYFTPAR
jgi:hypothetical protein